MRELLDTPTRELSLADIRDALERAHARAGFELADHLFSECVAVYLEHGRRREIVVALHPQLRWRVLDVGRGGEVRPLARLGSSAELRASARAVALDYVEHLRCAGVRVLRQAGEHAHAA